MKSWVPVPEGSDFPIQNLPFGVFKTTERSPRVGVAIGEHIVDLAALYDQELLLGIELPSYNLFANDSLNEFMALGRGVCRQVRERLSELLRSDNEKVSHDEELKKAILVTMHEAEMLMPVKVGDYTDFYSSIEHATNVGTMFRGAENALMPNYRHLPVGYHGRASSIGVSGHPIHRPKGQFKDPDDELPSFGPSRRLDFELEMAFITCKHNPQGDCISAVDAEEFVFGFVLFNDWSARDIQAWEYVPLGPFLGKNFASTVSPWVVTMDALEPFRVKGPEQNPKVLPYLKTEGEKNFDINLEVGIKPEGSEEKVVCHSNFKYMYWNINQQLAHHTINGCDINVGDMYASGTISGPTPESYGSMLEISWKGTKPVTMKDGSERKFINDHDTVIMRGYAEKDGVRIGFGEVKSKVLPAKL
ncbi:fumarylacetoacetase [Cytophagales bacterium RKSG123]|nr:fumarylacetoacetase [Xanthovirga aplysinae]